MNSLDIYQFDSYLGVLKTQISLNELQYAYKAKLAEAARCQRSFLSQVLAEQAHLSPEHAFSLADFWTFSASEKDYFLNLVLMQRASNEALKAYFRQKLELAKRDRENLTKRIPEKIPLSEDRASTFYSSWHYLAITIALTIREFRTVEALANRLGLRQEIIERTLNELVSLGIVSNSANEWLPLNSVIHLPNDSKFTSLNHSHWRKRAVDDSLLPDPKSIHYTSVCSLSLQDVEKLRQMLFRFIDETRNLVAPSEAQELFCLTTDWFRV